MAGISISNQMLEKYFALLKHLTPSTKQKLIDKLKNSMKKDSRAPSDPGPLFGAWEDDRSTEEIIAEIRTSRVEKRNTENFE